MKRRGTRWSRLIEHGLRPEFWYRREGKEAIRKEMMSRARQPNLSVPKKAAASALGQFLELHPVSIGQVVQVIIEHFRLKVMHELGRRAKAMVVTSSRLSAVRYKRAFDSYVQAKGYSGIRALVAFPGTQVAAERST